MAVADDMDDGCSMSPVSNTPHLGGTTSQHLPHENKVLIHSTAAEDMAATPCDKTSKEDDRQVSASIIDPNATDDSSASANHSTMDHDSADINNTPIASGTCSSTTLNTADTIKPSRSLTFAESLLSVGQITREQLDTLAAHIKVDMNAIGREHPLSFTFSGDITISQSLKHREVEAIGTVFNIAELLETILLLLPLEDLLLRVGGVCKGFRTAMQSSPKVLRKMYGLAVPFAGEPFEDFAHFPIEVKDCDFRNWSSNLDLWSTLHGLKATSYDRYEGLRARQISCPAVKAMKFPEYLLSDNSNEEVELLFNEEEYPLALVRKSEGISFGDIFDMLKQMKRGFHEVGFEFHPNINWGKTNLGS